MHLVTPNEIESVAWEGELALPETARLYKSAVEERLVATLGRPEVWPVADALEVEVGKKWAPPVGGAEFWLLRLACTLKNPQGRRHIVESTQTLYLRPKNAAAGDEAVYAYSLFPDRLTVEDKGSWNVKLGPELSFAEVLKFKPGEAGVTIEYRRAFPVIQGYGAGEAIVYWLFRPHAAHPLDGSQFVYAVVAIRPGAEAARATVELTATVETQLGPLRLGLPEEARAYTRFAIPAEGTVSSKQ